MGAEMTVDVALGSERVQVDRRVFELLFDNSVKHDYQWYQDACESGRIGFDKLVKESREARIPYPLFFAPFDLATAQVDRKIRVLLQGVKKSEFSMNARGSVRLADVELIVQDLLRKQALVKKHDKGLPKNRLVGLLKRSRGDAMEDAQVLMHAIGLSHTLIQGARNKTGALELLVERLEQHNILVSRSVNGYMPQNLRKVEFSGITVRDSKVPYIFLRGGSRGEHDEPEGRQVFTLTLLAVLVARGVFRPVTLEVSRLMEGRLHEYDVVSEILIPRGQLSQYSLDGLDAVREAAEVFKVTPSAVVVRGQHVGRLSREVADEMLSQLRAEWGRRSKSRKRNAPLPVNAVRKYNGREFSRRMVAALDSGAMSPKAFCREVCANRIDVSDIPEFRRALR